MQEVVVFTKDEFTQIKEIIDDMRDDIWEIDGSYYRAIIFGHLDKLKAILHISE